MGDSLTINQTLKQIHKVPWSWNFAGGRTPSFPSSIEFIEITSQGNGQDFGDLTQARESSSNNVASHVRGLFGGGYHPGCWR